MKHNSLADWLDYLEKKQPEFKIEMGLERVGSVADTLNLRKPATHCVLVAGTNGKGSTCVFIEALFVAAGYSVGTTLSPHLHAFNERVRLNGSAASDALIFDAFETVEQARLQTRDSPHLTYFEFALLAALCVFNNQGLDVCVLEVGLGGRLDAANIVDPDVSVITSIGIDHEEFLGSDRESIAIEKAGIMRQNVVCVYGEANMPKNIEKCAEKKGAILHQNTVAYSHRVIAPPNSAWNFDSQTGEAFRDLPLPSISTTNASTAIEATLQLIPLTQEVVAHACTTVSMPGRFEHAIYHGLNLLIDVAHNPHAAEFLLQQMKSDEMSKPIVGIAGFLAGKDVGGIVQMMSELVEEWVFVDAGFTGHPGRAQSGAKSAELALNQLPASRSSIISMKNVKEALNYYLNATQLPNRVVIMGSFDVVQKTHDIINQSFPR